MCIVLRALSITENEIALGIFQFATKPTPFSGRNMRDYNKKRFNIVLRRNDVATKFVDASFYRILTSGDCCYETITMTAKRNNFFDLTFSNDSDFFIAFLVSEPPSHYIVKLNHCYVNKK